MLSVARSLFLHALRQGDKRASFLSEIKNRNSGRSGLRGRKTVKTVLFLVPQVVPCRVLSRPGEAGFPEAPARVAAGGPFPAAGRARGFDSEVPDAL